MSEETQIVTDEVSDGEAVPGEDAAAVAEQAPEEAVQAVLVAEDAPPVADDVRAYVKHALGQFHDTLVERGQIPPPPPVAG